MPKKETKAQRAARIRERERKALMRDNLPRHPLGMNVRSIARHLSRDDMAVLVADAPSQMSRLMTGHTAEFSADRLVGYLRALGCDVILMVGDPTDGRRRGRVRVIVGVEPAGVRRMMTATAVRPVLFRGGRSRS